MATYEDKPLPFGKFKGILICEVPNWYLEFIKGEKWFREKFNDISELIDKELEYRKKFNIHIKSVEGEQDG